MPVMHHFRGREGAYVKAWVKGSIVTFQLSGEGRSRLHEAGLGDGMKFPLNLLVDLIREGHAFTKSGAGAEKADYHQAEQFVFSFAENEEAERTLPVCEVTGVFDDLHLVVHGDEGHAQLLAPTARASCPAISLSVPLAMLSKAALDQLVAAGKVSADASCVPVLREWFALNSREAWAKFRREMETPTQAALALEGGEELDFGGG